MYKVDNYINGKSCSISTQSSPIINPSYGREIGEVHYATTESANLAVESAYEAAKSWSKTGLTYRAELILKFRQSVIDRSSEIIDICINEAGKTKPDAEAELDRAVQALSLIHI